MKKLYLFFSIIFFVNIAFAQDLTGIWRGHFRSNNSFEKLGGEDDRYKFEVQIAQTDRIFKAVTYSYKSTVFYGKAVAEGTFNTSSKKALLKELKIVEVRMMGGDACIMTCFLQYSKLGDEEFLEGTYNSMNTRDSSSCGKGSIFLHKVANSDFGKEPFVEKREKEIERDRQKASLSPIVKPESKDSLKPLPAAPKKNTVPSKKSSVSGQSSKSTDKTALAGTKTMVPLVRQNKSQAHVKPSPKSLLAKTEITKRPIVAAITDSSHTIERKQVPVLIVPKVLSSRKNEVVRTITVNNNEVELRIYDDGTIDHDTVSVYVDNVIVINHAMLTDKPLITKLHLDEGNDYHEVVMVADNEGDIPPNTSLMVVKDGDKEYEVRIVSTEQKNATVIFRFEKK